MKKTLILAALFVAIASYGGSFMLANAQSLTPAQTAALQQELQVAKAQLVQLQMQEGQVPAGDNSLPGATAAPTTATPTAVAPTMSSVSLSAAEISQMQTALTALTGVLTSLQSQIASNPQFIATNGANVISVLQSIGNSVSAIATDIQNSNLAMTAPVATAPAAAPSAGSIHPTAASAPATTPSTPAATAAPTPAVTTPAATTPTPAATTPVAQATAGSSFSFSKLNWPLIIVIVLIVAAIAVWLWWDDGDEDKKTVVRTTTPSPQKPTVTIQTMNQPISNSSNSGGGQRQPANPSRQTTQPQTPMSAAVANQPSKPQVMNS